VGYENGTARLLFVVVFEHKQGNRSTESTDFVPTSLPMGVYTLLARFGIIIHDMTGLQLHAISSLQTIPALLVSANIPCAELKYRGILGLTKPFDLDELVHLIEQVVQKQE